MSRQITLSETKGNGISLFQIKPLLISLSFTLVLLSILALLIAYGPVSEKTATVLIWVINIICVFLSGFLSGKNNSSRGYLCGALQGTFYTLVSLVMAALAFGTFMPASHLFKSLLLNVFSGALGGIFGVNTRCKKRTY